MAVGPSACGVLRTPYASLVAAHRRQVSTHVVGQAFRFKPAPRIVWRTLAVSKSQARRLVGRNKGEDSNLWARAEIGSLEGIGIMQCRSRQRPIHDCSLQRHPIEGKVID